jgi:hypothetical protein
MLKQAEKGKMVMAGAFGETPEGALFIFKDVSAEVCFVKIEDYRIGYIA